MIELAVENAGGVARIRQITTGGGGNCAGTLSFWGIGVDQVSGAKMA